MRLYPVLIPVAALVAVLCLWHGGWSCGVDAPFHVQSWVDASQQMRHGVPYPRWTFLAAYNAGEPRFTFYPPISWELGGLLVLLLPIAAVPLVFVGVVLTVAGWSMYRAALPWSSPAAAFVAACAFVANPFMLFTVVTRAAYGELFAAAWCPLLLAGLLEARPRAWRIGVPLGLIWLSNVPGAVLAMYLVALLGVVRVGMAAAAGRRGEKARAVVQLGAAVAGGYILGLSLAAVYLLPALWERRWIHMADAYVPGMRPVDTLLPVRGFWLLPDLFLVRVGWIAVGLGVVTLVVLAGTWLRGGQARAGVEGTLELLVVFVVVELLVYAPAAWVWTHLPALGVAQFPWRALYILGCCWGFAVAGAWRTVRAPWAVSGAVGVVGVAVSALWLGGVYRHPCDASDRPAAILASLSRHHTPEPTDEYVSATADAEFLRPDNPPFWLTDDPHGFAAGTTPNLTSTDARATMPAVPDAARLLATPLAFSVTADRQEFLVTNLQRYPKWRVLRNGREVTALVNRPDGLIALPVPAGASHIAIVWRGGADEWIGWLVTSLALGLGLWRCRGGIQARGQSLSG